MDDVEVLEVLAVLAAELAVRLTQPGPRGTRGHTLVEHDHNVVALNNKVKLVQNVPVDGRVPKIIQKKKKRTKKRRRKEWKERKEKGSPKDNVIGNQLWVREVCSREDEHRSCKGISACTKREK